MLSLSRCLEVSYEGTILWHRIQPLTAEPRFTAEVLAAHLSVFGGIGMQKGDGTRKEVKGKILDECSRSRDRRKGDNEKRKICRALPLL